MAGMPGGGAPMGAIGSMLAQGAGQGGGPDQNLQATMGQIRQLGQMVAQLESQYPVLADEAQQITALLKAMVVKAAQAQSAQTPSGMAVPGGSMA